MNIQESENKIQPTFVTERFVSIGIKSENT